MVEDSDTWPKRSTSRRLFDADSHVLGVPGFLDFHIESSVLTRITSRTMRRLQPLMHQAIARARLRGIEDDVAAPAKERVGTHDPRERSRLLDWLGCQGQLVFATFTTAMLSARDQDLLYEGSRAHNRAMTRFCSRDSRLLAVGFVPLVDPALAAELAHEAVELGCAAIHVPTNAAGGRSPTHPDYDPFWAVLSEANVPFVLHGGDGSKLLDLSSQSAMLGSEYVRGGEYIREDFLSICHSPSLFLSALILDGVFDRFPSLRGAAIDAGANWVVSWMRQLDFAQSAFRRTELRVAHLALKASDYVRRHLKFTPFPGEPVGWMIEQAGAELFMFSTSYPYTEGEGYPLNKFDAVLDGRSEAEQDQFYYSNMQHLLRGHRTPGTQKP